MDQATVLSRPPLGMTINMDRSTRTLGSTQWCTTKQPTTIIRTPGLIGTPSQTRMIEETVGTARINSFRPLRSSTNLQYHTQLLPNATLTTNFRLVS